MILPASTNTNGGTMSGDRGGLQVRMSAEKAPRQHATRSGAVTPGNHPTRYIARPESPNNAGRRVTTTVNGHPVQKTVQPAKDGAYGTFPAAGTHTGPFSKEHHDSTTEPGRNPRQIHQGEVVSTEVVYPRRCGISVGSSVVSPQGGSGSSGLPCEPYMTRRRSVEAEIAAHLKGAISESQTSRVNADGAASHLSGWPLLIAALWVWIFARIWG